MAVGQVDVALGRPLAGRVPLAHAPDELADQAAGVAAVDLLVAGGDHVVEAERPGQRVDQVVGRGGGQHQEPALGPVGGQAVDGPGLDQVDQVLHRGFAGGAHGGRRSGPSSAGRRPGPGS